MGHLAVVLGCLGVLPALFVTALIVLMRGAIVMVSGRSMMSGCVMVML